MADCLKDSDKAPIISDYDFVIKGFRLRKRDVALGGLTFVCLVVIIILAAILAAKSRGHSGADEGHGNLCSTIGCLKSAVYITELLNETISPCENFHKYACGKFADLHPLLSGQSEITASDLIDIENDEKVLRLLKQPAKTTDINSFDRKLHDLYESCLDHFRKDQGRGKPLLVKVIKPSGGWWALQNSSEWTESKWDFNHALQKAHDGYWRQVLFSISHWNDFTEMYEVQISVPYSELHRPLVSENLEMNRKSVKKFIQTVGSLLLRDAELNLTHVEMVSRVQTFTQDVYLMASKLAELYNTRPQDKSEAKSISLEMLSNMTGGTVNWFGLISSKFNGVNWTKESKVTVVDMSYLTSLMNFIHQLDPSNQTRILNNYLVWCFAYNFIWDLSWEYMSAYRQFSLEVGKIVDILDTEKYCQIRVYYPMHDATSALFARQHFADLNKNKSHEITGYVKNVLLERLDSPDHWMSSSSRQAAKVKIQKSLIKLGYPDYLMQDQTMDSIYKSLTVDKGDYFGNLLSLDAFVKKEWSKSLTQKYFDMSEWFQVVFYPYAFYFNQWATLIISAGYLQFPLYDYTLPHCVNFGTLGTTVGKELVHAIDEFGKNYNERGFTSESWWTKETTDKYSNVETCMESFLQRFSPGVFKNKSEQMDLPLLLAESSSIQIAFRAYKDWVKENGAEKLMINGLLTSEQMFFVSYTQRYCYNRKDDNGRFDYMIHDVKVNAALAQVPEFQQAFNCPDTSKMVPATRCQLY